MFGNVMDALQTFKSGGLVLVADDENRENEVDMIMAAEFATEEHLRTMINHGTGIICCPMDRTTACDLGLKYMINPDDSTDPKGTAFTCSVDSKQCHTGVSASDRLLTIQALCANESLSSPGHMFPLIAHKHLLQGRQGHTEAAVTMCKLVKTKRSIAVIVEAMNQDGTMMRVKDIPRDWPYPIITIEQLKAYVESEPEILSYTHEKHAEFEMVKCDLTIAVKVGKMTEVKGEFCTIRAPLQSHAKEYSIFVYPSLAEFYKQEAPCIRLHSECMTGNVFQSCQCDCKDQFDQSLRIIVEQGAGAIMYIPGHEGRGIGLFAKTMAYKVQQEYVMDTYAANCALGFKEDQRDYSEAVRALQFMCDPIKVRCITNNVDKIQALQAAGIEVVSQIKILSKSNPHNEKYLATKKERNKAEFISHNSTLMKLRNGWEIKKRVLIVASFWNHKYVDQLIEQVRTVLDKKCDVEVTRVPGAWEIPYAVKQNVCADYDAVVAVGVLIKGGTKHFEYIAKNVFHGLMQSQLQDGACPVINGVLTVLEEKQIDDRIDLGRIWGVSTLEMMGISAPEIINYTDKI